MRYRERAGAYPCRTADRLLRFYQKEAHRPPQVLPAWDLYTGVIGIEHLPLDRIDLFLTLAAGGGQQSQTRARQEQKQPAMPGVAAQPIV